MMSLEVFRQSLGDTAPPDGVDLAIQALWWAEKGNWDRAHGCVQQQEGTRRCDHVHAFLHRQEGDLPNARYWYARAGRGMPEISLQAEWTAIATELLAQG